jgi:predicted tellurium resistance membrane protein TerC
MEWLIKLFGVPIIGKIVDGVVQGHKDSLAAGNTSESIAANLAARELVVQQREIEVTNQLRLAEIGKWYEPDHLAAYIFIAYIAKVVVWDVMLDLGSTPAIKGAVGEWLGLIAMFLFGKRGIENVARILKR